MATHCRRDSAAALIAVVLLSSRIGVAAAQEGQFCVRQAEAQSCPADVCPVAMVQYVNPPRPFSANDIPGALRVKRLALPNAYALAVPPETLNSPERMRGLRNALSQWGTVRWLESSRKWIARTDPNDEFYRHGPDGPTSDGQWALSDPGQVGAPLAFGRIKKKNSSLTRVAVLDTGIAAHPDLTARMWNGSPQHGMSFAGWMPAPSTTDTDGHGTNVAGVIAAVSNNGAGVASLGWRANTNLIAVKIMENQSGTCTDTLIDAIAYAVDPARDAKILNLSASSCACSEMLGAKLKELEENRPDVLVVAAVGEDSPPQDIDSVPDFPASYGFKNIIAVQSSDKDHRLVPSSFFGKSSVQIAAPGAHILSTTLASQGSYAYANGTSLAAPFVSATAALIRSLAPTWGYAEIRTYLMDSAGKSCSPPEPDRTLCGRNAADGWLNVDRATGPPIEITAPAAGAMWAHGVSQHVSWKPMFMSTVCTKVDVHLSGNGGSTFMASPLAAGVDVSAGGVDVMPPGAAQNAQIRIQCANTQLDRLSGPFRIN